MQSFFSGAGLSVEFFRPLGGLLFSVALSLAVAQLIESFRWTEFLAKITAPLVRHARFGAAAGASFSLAFFSPSAANALLAEGMAKGELSRRELLLAVIFNSAPSFFVHLPSLAAMAWAFLGEHAIPYLVLVCSAALLRTAVVSFAGHFLLPPRDAGGAAAIAARPRRSWQELLRSAGKRLWRRLVRLCLFTSLVYYDGFLLQRNGFFSWAEAVMGTYGAGFFLRPQALSIVALNLAAENGASFSAAASLLHSGQISPREVVLALLVGNIVSSPMRAFRHQLPSYAGLYAPVLAGFLVAASQGARAAALILVTVLYYYWS